MNIMSLIEGSKYRAEKAKQQDKQQDVTLEKQQAVTLEKQQDVTLEKQQAVTLEKQQVLATNAFQKLINSINKLNISFIASQSAASQKSTSSKSEVLDVLYKILNELKVIEDVLAKQIPVGKIINIPKGLSLTAGDTYVDFIKGLINYPDNTKVSIPTSRYSLFSISIENEGTDNCILTINSDESWGKRTVNSGETYELNMKKAVIKGVKLTVATGESCTIQISGIV